MIHRPLRLSSPNSIANAIVLFVGMFLWGGPAEFAEASDNLPVSSAEQLVTFSLAPDGTVVGNSKSSLIKEIGQRVGGSVRLEQIIATACQRWSSPTNLNFAKVEDSGSPFGTRGLPLHDPRFGDIRIAAIPMPADVRGVAFRRDSLVAGTWGGDIILNSKYPFKVDSLLAVVIHELGHSLGFEHIDGVNSVLNPSNKLQDLTAFDRLQLQNRYGVRQLDPYDSDSPNDTMKEAIELRMHGSDEGTIPALAFGDIAHSRDPDWFYLKPDQEFADDQMVIELRTNGNSLLQANLQVFDHQGKLLGTRATAGGIARLNFPVEALDEQCFFRITSRNKQFATGSYALVAYYQQRNEVPEVELAAVASWSNSHMRQNDLRERFQDGPELFFFQNDAHTNDTLATATLLEPIALASGSQMYRVDASVSDAIDPDYYQFDVSEDDEGSPLTIRVHSRDEGRLIPYASLYLPSGFSIPLQPVVNANGQLTLQVDGLPTGSYVVSVAPGADSDVAHTTGNYTLDLSFGRPLVRLPELSEGRLTPATANFHTIRVARSQMFHFGLFGQTDLNLPDTVVFSTIYNERGQKVFQLASRPSEFRSGQSILLSPGSYILRMEFVDPTGASAYATYRFSGLPDTDSEGPTVIDPTTSPFPQCDPNLDIYCYPEFRSPDPFIWVDGLSPDLDLPPAPPSDWDNVDNLYWPDTAIV